MKLTMLGTGKALVTECYNTCFLIEDKGQLFMTDGGGGNTVLRQIKHAGYNWMDIHHIFVTHKHTDHIIGILWMVRMICHAMSHGTYPGEAYIYSHREVLDLIRDISGMLFLEKESANIGKGLHLIEITDGETMDIIGHQVTFFDMQSTKTKQFGYRMALGCGKMLTCCGDEPLTAPVYQYAAGGDWLLHEAFCLDSQAEQFDPYEKHHCTVKDACELAEQLEIKNLVLYHTEDENLPDRKNLYKEEGSRYYHGTLWVPDDLESIEL